MVCLFFCLLFLLPAGRARADSGLEPDAHVLNSLSPELRAEIKLLRLCAEGSVAELRRALEADDLLVRLLEREPPLGKHHARYNNYPLHIAVQQNPDPEVLKLLVNAGARLESRDEQSDTPLLMAVAGGQADKVKLLVELGADVNVSNFWQTPALHIAAGKSWPVFELLYAAGADLHALDKDGKSVLHYAVQAESTEVADFLLRQGFSPKLADEHGNTPLHESVVNPQIVALLVAAGADLNCENNMHHTPIESAKREAAVADAFISGGAELWKRDAWGRVKARGFNERETYLSRCRFFKADEAGHYQVAKGIDHVQKAVLQAVPLEDAQGADSNKLLHNSLQFHFVAGSDESAMSDYKYYLLSESGTGVFGLTDATGHTARIYTEDEEDVYCYKPGNAWGVALADISFKEYDLPAYNVALPPLDKIKYGERVCFIDPEKHLPVAGYPYFVRSTEGVGMAGYTDEYGCSAELFISGTDSGLQFDVYGGAAAMAMDIKGESASDEGAE